MRGAIDRGGCRGTLRNWARAPSTGSARRRRADGGSRAAAPTPELDEYLHLYAVNRGVLMTPFHNMALMCPATTRADVDPHTAVFAAAVDELVPR